MFLNYLKNYFLKYTLKNKWREVVPFSSGLTITSIGLLIDEVAFKEKAALIEDLVTKGFQENTISILVHRETINPKYPILVLHIHWKAWIGAEILKTQWLLNLSIKSLIC